MDEHTKRRLEEKKRAVGERQRKMQEMQVQIQDILFEFNGIESNIPVNHGYWDLLNAFKTTSTKEDVEFLRQQGVKSAN